MHILIIEDEQGIRQELSQLLRNSLYEVTAVEQFDNLAETVLELQPDLVLLDLNLPGVSGFDVCADIRRKSEVPIIFVTSRTDAVDELNGMLKGGDDYITKPFSLSVLRARVNTQLRKQASNHKNAPFHMDLFHFDFEAMTFYVGDSKVELSKTEQKLLRLLVENRGRTMTRGDLVDRIWTDGAEYVDENALSVTIKRLRDKLGAQKYIKTVYGIGYSWVTKDE